MAARKTSKAMSFEEGLERLEALASEMERGELPLDELLKRYEEGIQLADTLHKKLEAAQGRMQEVRQGRDGIPVAVETDVVRQQSLLDELNENGGME